MCKFIVITCTFSVFFIDAFFSFSLCAFSVCWCCVTILLQSRCNIDISDICTVYFKFWSLCYVSTIKMITVFVGSEMCLCSGCVLSVDSGVYRNVIIYDSGE